MRHSIPVILDRFNESDILQNSTASSHHSMMGAPSPLPSGSVGHIVSPQSPSTLRAMLEHRFPAEMEDLMQIQSPSYGRVG